MCGIGGIVLREPDFRMAQALKTMQAHIAHRGPDGNGTFVNQDGCVGLVHTRLAIVDLSSAAAQPMDAHGNVIVFNGEIYNWRDLRKHLEGLGHRFTTNSDTETILAGYREWGADVLTHLRGMFAFAIWNKVEQILFCARDRIGKKPFIYAEGSNGFCFASEIPAIRAASGIAGVNTTLDGSALAAMLLHNLRHIPEPATVYRGIRKLRAGYAMMVRAGRVEKSWRYWNPQDDADSVARPVTPLKLRAMLEECVELRRVADVPVGALLSGGVDSSAIVALAQRKAGQPVRTYAMGLDADDEDLRRARFMAGQIGTTHREFYFDASRQWTTFNRILTTYGEPIMLLPLVYTFELCEAIRGDGIKVVLSGNGADELFYGYTGMVQTGRLSRAVKAFDFLAPFVRLLPAAQRGRALQVFASQKGVRKAALYRHYASNVWPSLIAPEALKELDNYAEAELAAWGSVAPNDDYIDESNFCGLMVENTHSVTIAADLPAMMAGVEMRAPFLDQQMIALALATPWREKIVTSGEGNHLKKILKQAVSDLMPPDILYASKRGFGMGIAQDDVIRHGWREHGRELFSNPDHADGLFSKPGLRNLWQCYLKGEMAGSSLPSNMFAIQLWLQSARAAA